MIGDLLVMNPDFLESYSTSPWYFWQNEPCRLINSWGKVLEYLRFSFAEGPFFLLFIYSLIMIASRSQRDSHCLNVFRLLPLMKGRFELRVDLFEFLEKEKKYIYILKFL